MRPIIEYCTSNLHHGTEEVIRKLEQRQDCDVMEYGCLGNCNECFLFPYVMVNGEIVAGEDADQLYNAILEKIKELEAWDNLFETFDD